MKYLSISLVVLFGGISTMMFNNLPTEINGEQALFEKFLESFDELELPHTVAVELELENQQQAQVQSSEKLENVIDYEFAEYIPGLKRARFSRMPPSTFKYEGLVENNDLFAAVIYSEISFYNRRTNTPDKYVLVTYSKKKYKNPSDRIIDMKGIAGRRVGKMQATINKDLSVEMNDFLERGNDGKTVVSLSKFQITPTGKIAEMGKSKPSNSLQQKLKVNSAFPN